MVIAGKLDNNLLSAQRNYDRRMPKRNRWSKALAATIAICDKMNSIEVVKEYWSRMQTNDFSFAAEVLSDNFTLDWPQSNERIKGKKNFIAVNSEYPSQGRWKFNINRIVGDEKTIVTDVSVTDGSIQARAITFSTVEDDKIVKQVEYWPDEYSAPENRKHLVESIH